jgi:hypothetical protein
MLFVAKPLSPNPPGNFLDWVIFGHGVLHTEWIQRQRCFQVDKN